MMNDKGEEACLLEDCYLPANQQQMTGCVRPAQPVLLKHRHFGYQH